jgi:UPF0271 protein
MVKNRRVTSIDGVEIPVDAGTICVHGDTQGAVEMTRSIRECLERDSIAVEAFGRNGCSGGF